jgi:hypothetical protein
MRVAGNVGIQTAQTQHHAILTNAPSLMMAARPLMTALHPISAVSHSRSCAWNAIPSVITLVRGIKTQKRQIRDRTPHKVKLKSRKSVVKRFFRTASGKLKVLI